jgi:hypothetical protein
MSCNTVIKSDTPLWVDDVSILWRDPYDFFPIKPKTDGASRTNAIVRFVLYASVILAIYKKNILPLLYGSGVILLATFLHTRGMRRRVRISSTIASGEGECRQATQRNPYMNTPTVEMGSLKEPCYDQMDVSDEYANMDTVRDVDDILREPIENRAFYTLPGGGGPPDFTKLSKVLARDAADSSCSLVGKGRW